MFLLLCTLFYLGASCADETYIPPVYYGEPISAQVEELQGPDFRGEPVYLVTFSILLNGTDEEQYSLVHRNYDEFVTLSTLLPGKSMFPWEQWLIAQNETTSIDELNEFIQSIMSYDETRLSVEFSDFLSINWNADDVTWFETLPGFMYMLLFARIPLFQPEPPIFGSELDTLVEETAFEKYIYMSAFRAQEDLNAYMEYFRKWIETNPPFNGNPDDSDVWFPGAVVPLELPYHYTKTFVHFLPDGYTNGRTVRISYTGNTKFNFLKEDIVRDTIQDLYSELTPTRILDIGTGNCYSAFVYGEEYPDAEVYGIDLAAPYIRFCKMWQNERPGSENVHFYQDNAESTHFEDESFDLIQYTYVVHEMPEVNAEMLVNEAYRLLKPGGVFSGFEVPFIENVLVRQISIISQTWGCHWNETQCDFGPEPYMEEYEAGTKLPRMLERVGFVNNTNIHVSSFDGIYVSYKPW